MSAKLLLSFFPLISLSACQNAGEIASIQGQTLSEEQKQYWYQGEAEITSFKIEQARYGELRTGNAVMIFVTEDFSTSKYTKTTADAADKVSVLKMNFTKNFVTGIYPYSIMTSSFVPFVDTEHALKISTSVQEWCGHVYMELVRKKKYNVSISSYFEDESINNKNIPITYLEDELWSKIRIAPNELPIGNIDLIPSFVYLRLMHIDIGAYKCDATLSTADSISIYKISYPELDRTLSISFATKFPHEILSWQDEYLDGFGENKVRLISTGSRIKTIKSSYWTKNKSIDQPLRKELGLE